MEISTFKVKVQKAVSEVLGQEYTVELREVQKNNGVLLQGLMIRKGQDNVTPTIYLNSFWEAYEGGVTFADIIKKIISIYKEDGIGRKIDVSFFQDFEKVKEKRLTSLLWLWASSWKKCRIFRYLIWQSASTMRLTKQEWTTV